MNDRFSRVKPFAISDWANDKRLKPMSQAPVFSTHMTGYQITRTLNPWWTENFELVDRSHHENIPSSWGPWAAEDVLGVMFPGQISREAMLGVLDDYGGQDVVPARSKIIPERLLPAVRKRAEELEVALDRLPQPRAAGPGHNRPPEPLDAEDQQELREAASIARNPPATQRGRDRTVQAAHVIVSKGAKLEQALKNARKIGVLTLSVIAVWELVLEKIWHLAGPFLEWINAFFF